MTTEVRLNYKYGPDAPMIEAVQDEKAEVVGDISPYDDTGTLGEEYLTFNFNPHLFNADWEVTGVRMDGCVAHVYLARKRRR